MNTNWTTLPLKEVCLQSNDLYSKKDGWGFVNYLDTGNITENQIEQIQHFDLNLEKLPSRARKKIRQNDVVFSLVRPNKKHYGIIKTPLKNMLVSTGFSVLRGKENILDNGYLYYYLCQDKIIEQLQCIAEDNASTYPALRQSDLDNLEISLPHIDIQRKISNFLMVFDDKIYTNNKIIKTLEEISSFEYQRTTQNQLKTIQLKEFCNIQIKKEKVDNIDIESYLSTENILPYKMGTKLASSIPTYGKVTQYAKGDTLISNIRPYFQKIVFADRNGSCSNDVICFRPKDKIHSSFLYFTLWQNTFFDFMMQGSNGTKMPRGDKQHIMEYDIAIPNDKLMNQFINFADKALTSISILRNENNLLNKIRDFILPELMSGKIKLND